MKLNRRLNPFIKFNDEYLKGLFVVDLMPLKYEPKYRITDVILKKLLEIEAIKEKVKALPLTPKVLTSLRESSKLFSTHYSTMIEGNRLTQKEVSEVILQKRQIKGKARD